MHRFFSRHGLLLAAAVALAAILCVAAGAAAPASRGFHINYPDDWKQAKAPSSPASAGPIVAYLAQKQNKGYIAFHRAGKAPTFNQAYVNSIEKSLHKSTPGYKPVNSRTFKLAGVTAFYFSYTTPKTDTLTTLTIIPNATQSYVIDTLCSARDKKTAKEIGTIIDSFTFVNK